MSRRGGGSVERDGDSSQSPLDFFVFTPCCSSSLLAGEDTRGGDGSLDCSCTGLVCGLSSARNSLPGTNLGTLNSMMVVGVTERRGQQHARNPRITITLAATGYLEVCGEMLELLFDVLAHGFAVLFLVGAVIATLVLLISLQWREQNGDKVVMVMVLGDVGRSPRMQYHCLSLVQTMFTVELVGYDGE